MMKKETGRIMGVLLALMLTFGFSCAVCFAEDDDISSGGVRAGSPPGGVSINLEHEEDEDGYYYVNLRKDGSTSVTIPSAFTASIKVYDDGGSNGNHSSQCDSHLIIKAPEDTWIQLSGLMTCVTRWGKGNLHVYDGLTTDDAALIDGVYSDLVNAPVDVGTCITTGHNMHIYFHYNGSGSYAGLDLTVRFVKRQSNLEGAGTEASPYLIRNAADWDAVCSDINRGAGEADHFKLADDFDNSTPVTTMMGAPGHPFRGVFDGNGKTLRTDINYTEQDRGTAPFRYINGATIKNLTVEGRVYGSLHTGGIVAFADGGSADKPNKIENCVVDADVGIATTDTEQYIGGVVAHINDSFIEITNTIFSGHLQNYGSGSGHYAGGIVGWGHNSTLTMHDCLFKGTYEGGGEFHPIAIRNGTASTRAIVTGCLYTQEPTLTEQKYMIAAGQQLCAGVPENKVYGTFKAFDGVTYYAPISVKGLQDKYEYSGGEALRLGYTFVAADGTALVKNVDYTETIKDSKGAKLRTVTDKGEYTVTITGKGDYAGSQEFSFSVVDAVQYRESALVNGIRPADGGFVYMNGIRWQVIGENADRWLLISAARLSDTSMWWENAAEYCDTVYETFGQAEKDAVLPTTKTDEGYTHYTSPANCYFGESTLTDAHIFLPSGEEAAVYFDSDVKRLPGDWWLRSPIPNPVDQYAGAVDGDDGRLRVVAVVSSNAHANSYVRPALQLNMKRVLCLSGIADTKMSEAAENGRFGNLIATSDSGQKLTIVDDSRNGFTASADEDSPLTVDYGYSDWKIDLSYSGALQGTNEYVSAMLCDANDEAICYASLTSVASGSGSWDLSIPNGLDPGKYILKVFSEKRNDGILADYASAPVSIPLTVSATIDNAVISVIPDKVYTGKAIKPIVTVTKDGYKLHEGIDYTITYSNNKNVGKAVLTVKGSGVYQGAKKRNFKIIPKRTAIKKLKKAKKAFTAIWNRQSARMSKTRITGYQIQLATNKAFTRNAKKVKVKGYKNTSRKFTKLKKKRRYYVRIRTYKIVSGATYYSNWSLPGTVTTR